jgi:cytochrome c553
MTCSGSFPRAAALLAALAAAAFARDAASLYKSRCASCHGPAGAGRPAIKGSNLLTDEMKKLTDEELYDGIATGGKRKIANHAYEKRGLSKQQMQDLAAHVRELQKKN